jgi:hypothetical protein
MVWGAAPAWRVDPDRMLRDSRDEGVYYQSVWKAGDDELLVIVREQESELTGTPYDVFVLDRSLRLLRRGTIVASQDDFPYSLVEIKTASESVPAAYRGRWILAVALWSDELDYDPSLPVHEINFSVGTQGAEREPNFVYVEPVKWDDEPQRFKYGSHRLVEAEDVQIRRAEPAR